MILEAAAFSTCCLISIAVILFAARARHSNQQEFESHHDSQAGFGASDAQFWPAVRTSKLVLICLLALQLGLAGFALGFKIVLEHEFISDLFLCLFLVRAFHCKDDLTLMVLCARIQIYMVLLLVHSVKTKNASTHASLTWHVACLAFVSACVFAVRLVPERLLSVAQASDGRLRPMDFVQFALASLVFLRAGSIDTGPPLYFDPTESKFHKGATEIVPRTKRHPSTRQKVSSLCRASPLSYLLFGWATEIVDEGNRDPTLSNLPRLTSQYRARLLFDRFTKIDWDRSLLMRILYVNRKSFTAQIALACRCSAS